MQCVMLRILLYYYYSCFYFLRTAVNKVLRGSKLRTYLGMIVSACSHRLANCHTDKWC